MKVKQAINVFGSRAAIAQALEGVRHRSAVYQWPEDSLVPLGAAFTLAKVAPPGTLQVDYALYEHAHKRRRKAWTPPPKRKRKVKKKARHH